MVNVYLLIAAIIATAAVTLHVYTMEVWIWPKLKDEGFPSFPFGGREVVKGFYRTVWHFFTVNLLTTITVLLLVAFGNLLPYGMLIVQLLIIFWILIVVEIFIIGALSLRPGDSYIMTMLRAYQWVIIVVFVSLMYLGTRV